MNASENGNSTADMPYILYNMEFVIVSAVFYVLIIIASLLGNTMACLVILGTRSLRQSIDTWFVLSLAVSDLLTTCLVMPFDLEQIILQEKWSHGEIMCTVWTTAYLLAVPTSILNLLALSFHRFLTVKKPLDRFKVSPMMTRGRVIAVIVALWLYSLLFSLVPIFGWKSGQKSVINGVCFFNISAVYSVLSSVVNFLIPVLATCLIHCRMYQLAIKSRNSFPLHGANLDGRKGKCQAVVTYEGETRLCIIYLFSVVNYLIYYTHFEITGDSCNLIIHESHHFPL